MTVDPVSGANVPISANPNDSTDVTQASVQQAQLSAGVDVMNYVGTLAQQAAATGTVTAADQLSLTDAYSKEVGGIATLLNTLQGTGNSDVLASINQDVTGAQTLLSNNQVPTTAQLQQLAKDYQMLNQLASQSTPSVQATYWGQVQTLLQKLGASPLLQSNTSAIGQQATALIQQETKIVAGFQQYWQAVANPSSATSTSGSASSSTGSGASEKPQSVTDLGRQLVNIMLGPNGYMVSQNNVLNAQAQQLNFSNWTAGIYTGVLQNVGIFGQAGSSLIFNQTTLKNDSQFFSGLTPKDGASSVLYATLPQGTTSLSGFDYTTLAKQWSPTQPTIYVGSASSAQLALTNEINYTNTGVKGAQTAIQQLQEALTALSPPGTSATAAFVSSPDFASNISTLKTQINVQITNLQNSLANLKNLQGVLSQIKIAPPPSALVYITGGQKDINYIQEKQKFEKSGTMGTSGTDFTPGSASLTNYTSADHFCLENADGTPFTGTVNVPGSVPGTTKSISLAQAENSLLNGGSSDTSDSSISSDLSKSPSLGNLGTALQGSSQAATQQSQTQQMKLQMIMTEVQQEWTVISTLLQTYNQAVMQPAQALHQ